MFTVLGLIVNASPMVKLCTRCRFPDWVVMRMLVGEKKAGSLIAVDEVTRIEVVLRVDGVVDAGDELVVR